MIKQVLAEAIKNPVVDAKEGIYEKVAVNPLGYFIVRLWQTVIVVGGLTLLLFLIWGAIDWLMSEGEADKLKNAKNKIIHAIAGMAILAASFAIASLMKYIFGFDPLKISWPTP